MAEPCGSDASRHGRGFAGWPVRFAVIPFDGRQPSAGRRQDGELRRADRGAEVRGGEPPVPLRRRLDAPRHRDERAVLQGDRGRRGALRDRVHADVPRRLPRQRLRARGRRPRRSQARQPAGVDHGAGRRAAGRHLRQAEQLLGPRPVQLPGGLPCARRRLGRRRLRRRRADEALVPERLQWPRLPRRRHPDHRPPGVRVPLRAGLRGARLLAVAAALGAAPKLARGGPRVSQRVLGPRRVQRRHAARARASPAGPETTAPSAASTRWSKSASTPWAISR